MILQLITLTGALVAGYKSWNRQDKNQNQRILDEQTLVSNAKKEGDEEKNLGAYLSNKLESKQLKPYEIFSLSSAVVLSGIGNLFYLPLTYLAIPLFFYPNRRIFFASWDLLKQGRVDIETLLSGALIGAVMGQHIFIASVLALLYRISDALNARVLHESHLQLMDIFEQLPKTVWLLKDGMEIELSLAEVAAGDILAISAGEVIPVDGSIIWGMAGVDQHRLTGESMPVEKGEGEIVFAMTLVLSGKIHVKVDKAGAETSAMKIADILNQTSEYKSLTNLRAETFSRHLVHPALITSAIAWPLLGFNAAIAVLFVHPKNRLSISAPLSLHKRLNQATEQNILIKDGRSLELLKQVDTIVFDKTGTLTEDQPHIGSIYCLSNDKEAKVLYFAAVAEQKQTHPLALAVVAEAKRQKLSIPNPEQTECRLGYGVKALLDKQSILVGSARFMEQEKVPISTRGKALQTQAAEQGYGLIMVAVEGQLIGAIEMLPTVRPEAKRIIQQLKQMPQIKHICIISGDNAAPTHSLAKELGIDDYFAQTLPDQKADKIKQLQEKGAFVCFIGDGINDAIAMKQAQVSVSLSGASHIATDTAQIILLNQGIQHLPHMFTLANGFHHHMNNQLGMMLSSSVFGMGAIFLAGWGMGNIMLLNLGGLLVSLGYSYIDKPEQDDTNKLPEPK